MFQPVSDAEGLVMPQSKREMILCPKCGGMFAGKPLGENVLHSAATGKVAATARDFGATCPTDGPFRSQKFGRHATQQVKNLRRSFPKAKRRTMRALMDDDEWRRFNQVIFGEFVPTDTELARWKALKRP
jgi:hypothetical protein